MSRSGRPRTGRSAENIATIQAIVDETPTTSSRNMARVSGIKRGSILNILKKCLKLKSYIPTLCQGLHEDDYDRRLQFAQTFLTMVENKADILKLILWSDEANFKLNGHVNRHNAIYWSANNPHQLMPVAQQGPGVMVWCGILDDEIIGPFCIDEGTVTGVRYQQLLQHKVLPAIQNRPDFHQLYFQQDGGAQPHYYSLVARGYLDEIFPQRWIGRRGPVEWPARSPDLTPPDFWLWGYVKDNVYGRKPDTMASLKLMIEEEIGRIPADMIRHVTQSMVDRCQRLIEKNGLQLTK